MDALGTVTRQVEDGFVLNEQGRWIHMAEQLIYEKRVMHQLTNGNVLLDGKWVAIGEARRRAKPRASTLRAAMDASAQSGLQPKLPIHPIAPPTAPQAEDTSFEAVENMLETVCISTSAMNADEEGL